MRQRQYRAQPLKGEDHEKVGTVPFKYYKQCENSIHN